MIEKFNKNAKVEKFTNMLGIAVRLIVLDPYWKSNWNITSVKQIMYDILYESS